ncbi:hypothetical protein L1987_85542 [Smallanthus sonchifolius]|uniref:Uncharacterized protein n=1 Tax=Smallanthus sonchifolius TaxID=185202 RepID=A0ACB8XX15_9ASTR|nr:hypothetical protein L1987_85542 [Smallanthus sonchifolius]
MKHKRGKKRKSEKAPKVGTTEADPNIDNLSAEDTSGPSDVEKDETNSITEIKTPLTGTDQPEKPPSVSSTAVTGKPVGRLVYNRVKVKIKSSKALEPQLNSSDAHTHSDTDKSSQHIGLEKQVVSEKVEDSANSVPETNLGGPTTQPKKTGSIKIKSSKGFSSSLSPCNNAGVPQVERTHQKEPESVSKDSVYNKLPQVDRTHQKEPESVSKDSVYNKQELNASLEVIKKIMKMDAAEPFNAPVNPVALGIPDYFDVIKTPMDFGTICSNLERGVKYMNSEDVYKDVQYIWENCYKYNNKGDYVLELMKRVKKNFSKYWSAAGLYNEQPQGDMKDGNISSHGKSSNKGGQPKNKSRKRQGVKRHKDDCLCAICIMMRRRQEREHIMNPADDQPETSDGLVKEVKHEGTSTVGSPTGDDTSSSTDNSQNQDEDVEMEDAEDKLKLQKEEMQSTLESKQQEEKEKEIPLEGNNENGVAERSQQDVISGTEKHGDIQMAEAGDANKYDSNNDEKTKQQEDENAAVEHQKHKEVLDVGEKAKLYKKLHQRYDNPMILELYASLFPENDKSLWGRPHSMVHHRNSSRSSSIGAAIATFMKR